MIIANHSIRLFATPINSDVTIKIADKTINAHRLIICSQCELLKNRFQKDTGLQGIRCRNTRYIQQFEEGQSIVERNTVHIDDVWDECQRDELETIEFNKIETIELNDGSPAACYRFLEYLYTGAYSNELSTDGLEEDPDLRKHVRAYAVAKKFQMQDLATLATKKFENQLRAYCLDASFPICVRELYETTTVYDDIIRSVAVKAAISSPQTSDKSRVSLVDADTLITLKLDCIKDLLSQGGDFAVDCSTVVVNQCIIEASEFELVSSRSPGWSDLGS
ncbi:hypothetical protein K3495_g4223 [Podosphaera aphanis]|nr:hypothetical protein K3495_g4223 [Podosphaera aphanis]